MTAATSAAAPAVRRAVRRPRRRTAVLLMGLAVTLLAVFAARVLLGDSPVTVGDFFRIVAGEKIPVASYIVREDKLPRAVLGTLVGAALGLSGAIFQVELRNPLASPDVVGVTVGASAAAVFAIITLHLSGLPVSAIAILGALSTLVLLFVAAGTTAARRFVLVGVGVSAALLSVVQYLLTRADVVEAQVALRWLVGSLNDVDWSTIRVLGLLLTVLFPLTAWLARGLRVSVLGPDTARGLGLSSWHGPALLGVAVLLTAVAVAAAGPVSFVSFLAGPIARTLNGRRSTLLGSALTGAVIVVGADYLGAYGLPGTHLPVGIVTGAVGALVLATLMATGRLEGTSR